MKQRQAAEFSISTHLRLQDTSRRLCHCEAQQLGEYDSILQGGIHFNTWFAHRLADFLQKQPHLQKDGDVQQLSNIHLEMPLQTPGNQTDIVKYEKQFCTAKTQ